jgi:hypothetical protein
VERVGGTAADRVWITTTRSKASGENIWQTIRRR